MRPDVRVCAENLLDITGLEPVVTEEGVRVNIRVAIGYLNEWLGGNGNVALENLLEDVSTAEISPVADLAVDPPRGHARQRPAGDPALVERYLGEELALMERTPADHVTEAVEIFRASALTDDFPEFLTVPAYTEHLVDRVAKAAVSAPERTVSAGDVRRRTASAGTIDPHRHPGPVRTRTAQRVTAGPGCRCGVRLSPRAATAALGLGVELVRDRAVDRFPDDVGVSGVPRDLRVEVGEDPAHRHVEVLRHPRVVHRDLRVEVDPVRRGLGAGGGDLGDGAVEGGEHLGQGQIRQGRALEGS